jgi:hypothetical protein
VVGSAVCTSSEAIKGWAARDAHLRSMTNERSPWCRKELGHVMLHGPHDADAAMHRGIAEVEAESVALMVGAGHGLATDDYTVPYVATWAGSVPGKSPVEVVQSTAERVRGAAVTILDKLETRKVGNGDPPGLDREALTTRHGVARARASARQPSEVLGR